MIGDKDMIVTTTRGDYPWLSVTQVFSYCSSIRVITKLPNTEQSSKGKCKTHKSTNRQNQSTIEGESLNFRMITRTKSFVPQHFLSASKLRQHKIDYIVSTER